MDTETKPKRTPRRSHYQIAASKKLRYAIYQAGDGEWLTLARCGRRWCYWLFDDKLAADMHKIKMDRDTCGPSCRQLHSIFRLVG